MALGAPEVCNQVTSSQSVRGLLPCTAQQQQQQQQLPALPPTPQQQPPLNNHMISQADDLNNPFGQMSLSRQGSTEAADPSSALFQTPLISQHPQQTSFIMASTGQPLPTSNYSTSSHAPPTQQVLPPQGYMQPLNRSRFLTIPLDSILTPTSNIDLFLTRWPTAPNVVSSCLSHPSSLVYSP